MSIGPRVETSTGWIEGARVGAPDGTRLCRFLGVPYAAAPVGRRRTFDRDGCGDAVGAIPAAHALRTAMRGAWTSFAPTGAPSRPALEPWPSHDPVRQPTMCSGARSSVVADPDGATRALWMP